MQKFDYGNSCRDKNDFNIAVEAKYIFCAVVLFSCLSFLTFIPARDTTQNVET